MRGSCAEGTGLVQPGEEKAWMGPLVTFQYLRGGYQEDRARLFILVCGGLMRNNKYKLKQEVQARYNENLFCYEDSQVLE